MQLWSIGLGIQSTKTPQTSSSSKGLGLTTKTKQSSRHVSSSIGKKSNVIDNFKQTKQNKTICVNDQLLEQKFINSRKEMLKWNGVLSHHLCTNETLSNIENRFTYVSPINHQPTCVKWVGKLL